MSEGMGMSIRADSIFRRGRRAARLFVLALLPALVLPAAPAPPSAAAEEAASSREEFERRRAEAARRAARRQAEFMTARLSLFERDGAYVEAEVEKRVRAGSAEAEALDQVAGSGRAGRIARARQRLLEVHFPSERARSRVLGNYRAVAGAMRAAGFAPAEARSAIPLVESTYNPAAFNIAERLGGETVKGMWQFTESTGREYGLEVTSRKRDAAAGDPDERYDPEKSSRAARAYLGALDGFPFANGCPATEELVIASYHMGQGNANRKIRKYGCDFWAWRKDGVAGFGVHSYNYPALVLAGRELMAELAAE